MEGVACDGRDKGDQFGRFDCSDHVLHLHCLKY